MFWDFMHRVHHLPTFDRKDVDPWWTEEEKRMLELVQHQVSYMRNEDSELPLCPRGEEEPYGPCFGAVDLYIRDGKEVCVLPDCWVEFFEEHLGLGKYLASVNCNADEDCIPWVKDSQPDLSGIENVRVTYDNERGPMWNTSSGVTMHSANCEDDCEDCEVDVMDVLFDGEKVGVAYCYEEGPDVEIVHVFEKGSIAYAHYGRGCGLSVRLHESIGSEFVESSIEEKLQFFAEV